MGGTSLQYDMAFDGPRKDERRAEVDSLFDGLGCDGVGSSFGDGLEGVFGDVGFDEHDSLFGGGETDVDVESLFGGVDEEEPPATGASPPTPPPPPFAIPFPLPLALPLPPLPLPAVPSSPTAHLDYNGGFCDVSTLLPEHNHQEDDEEGVASSGGLPLPDPGPSAELELEMGLRLEMELELELELGRETQEREDGAEQESSRRQSGLSGDRHPPQLQPIDTPFRAAGLDRHDDQDGHGRVQQAATDDGGRTADGGGDTDDVVVLSERQVQRFVPPVASVPHYLELRPRCPQLPPPPRIDLNDGNVEELLPYVQLHSKLPIQGIQELLGLDIDAGRYVVAECRRHLADPAHTIVLSGSCDPAALRVLKVTLILSSLALLMEGEGRGGVGERWFGRSSPLEPKSMHVWPDDSTTLTLVFIQLLYRLTRNNSARERHRKINATAVRKARPRAPNPRKRKARSPPIPEPLPPPLAPAGPPRPNLAYNSPRCLREALISLKEDQASKSTEASPPAWSPGTSTAASYHARPPADATIRYLVNVVDRGSRRIIPQIVLGHGGSIRSAGYSHLAEHCAGSGQHVASISIVTLLGLEKVDSDVSWDRVVCRVHDEMLMDGEVRVLVCME